MKLYLYDRSITNRGGYFYAKDVKYLQYGIEFRIWSVAENSIEMGPGNASVAGQSRHAVLLSERPERANYAIRLAVPQAFLNLVKALRSQRHIYRFAHGLIPPLWAEERR